MTYHGSYSASSDGKSWVVQATATGPPNLPLLPGFPSQPNAFRSDFATTIPSVMAIGERVETILSTPNGELAPIIIKIADVPS